jgi:predicted 3-demethylubiquinone-9 3-methyltransferase (glyoxalase superfamily)
MKKTTTFLLFVGEQCGKAEEAMKLYTSLFNNSEIKNIEYFKNDEQGEKEGQVKLAVFTLNSQEYMVSESSLKHDFTFTPSMSIFVECDTEDEMNMLFKKLTQNGKIMMPLDNYEFSKMFAWVADKYGVSWQLNLAK